MAKIDTSKDFTKYVGSLKKAEKLVRSLLGKDENQRMSKGMRGRSIAYAKGYQDNFEWSYHPTWKTLTVTYTDGREKPEEKEYPEYYIAWIEGVSPDRGEKLVSLDNHDHEITTSMTQALRILPKDRELVKEMLVKQGLAEWALQNLFIRTNYAPRGTVFNPSSL